MRKSATFRLTQEAIELLSLMSEKLGISQAAVIELAIRHEAEREKIERRK
jgi:predicted transcriptional regulator